MFFASKEEKWYRDLSRLRQKLKTFFLLQENGFSWRETTNSKPASGGSYQDSRFDFTRTIEDEEEIDQVLDASESSKLLPGNSSQQIRCSCR